MESGPNYGMVALSDMRPGRFRCCFPEVEIARFLSSGSKYLQNSSREQKISIIFAVVIGVWIDCNLLFGSYKNTK